MYIDGIEYYEDVIPIKDINKHDLVMGSDGQWKHQDPLNIQEAESLYKIVFDIKGYHYVICDGKHEWTLFNKSGHSVTLQTQQLNGESLNYHVGNKDGLKIKTVEQISNLDENGSPIKVRCIRLLDSEDQLFSIYTSTENSEPVEVLTHNCGLRAAAGRLGAVPSRMLFDNQKATTISNNPGSALIRANSIYFPTQVYYEDDERWLKNWFLKRGLSEYGFDIKAGETDTNMDPDDIDLGEDEELEIEEKVTEIEFNDVEARIDNTRGQKFEEV